jgi:predicted ribosome quality control (RQC) complex YloA/Tae2 family protein
VEGLLLAAVLERLAPLLPAPTAGWTCLSPDQLVLHLVPDCDLWIDAAPGNPQLALKPSRRELPGTAPNPFQRAVIARLRGPLQTAFQHRLDRVVCLEFGAQPGFVPTPGGRLVFEPAGRQANLYLLGPGEGLEGRLLAVLRETAPGRNRYRQLRPGQPYLLPPAYSKFDPRQLDPDALAQLAACDPGEWYRLLDGLSPRLSRVLAEQASRYEEGPSELLAWLLSQIQSGHLDPGTGSVPATPAAAQGGRIVALEHQLAELEGLPAPDQSALRAEADLILAAASSLPRGSRELSVPDPVTGNARVIALDPALDGAENAALRYQRLRQEIQEYRRRQARIPQLRAELSRLRSLQADRARRPRSPKPQERLHGLVYRLPSGVELRVGRNAAENEAIRRQAKSQDYWFHAQGSPGSHVIALANRKPLPVTDLLAAAQVAAHHSRLAGSAQVLVDYTLLKHVWKPKGARPGEVHFSHQKTLVVRPDLPEGVVKL